MGLFSSWLPIILLALLVQAGFSRTIVVSSTADLVDANPGDGICASGAGDCTLRAAIQEANASPGLDVVLLAAERYVLTIAGARENGCATGDLDIADDIALIGRGPAQTTIDGMSHDRILHVLANAQAVILRLSIEHGSESQGEGGGGIYNQGSLLLSHAAVRLNSSTIHGGGIHNAGNAKLISVFVEGNSASQVDGGVRNTGTIAIEGGAIQFNSSLNGTGALSNRGTATLTDVMISNNSSNGDTGGVWSAATITISGVTFYGNTCHLYGGGVTIQGGTGTLINVTITGNTAGEGGGLANVGGNSTLANVTLDGNGAELGGNIQNRFGTVVLRNTIVANNTLGDNCTGIISSDGYNLDSGTTCQFTGTGDISGADPLLAELADNGGPTPTQALLTNSPAIDQIPIENCAVTTDQRGEERPQGQRCDIGAFEVTQP